MGARVNRLIFEARRISVVSSDEHPDQISTAKLPQDYDTSQGVVRVVSIDGIDANPCCGTHLQNTGQIQAVALLHQQNVRGGHSRLFFVCGARTSLQLLQHFGTLKSIAGNQLSCTIDEVPEKVALAIANCRKAQAREIAYIKELASLDARRLAQGITAHSVQYIYRPDPAPEYFTQFQREWSGAASTIHSGTLSTHTIVLLNGDEESAHGGMVKIIGPKSLEISQQLHKRLSNLKGGGRGCVFQGKISQYLRGELGSVLEYLDSLTSVK